MTYSYYGDVAMTFALNTTFESLVHDSASVFVHSLELEDLPQESQNVISSITQNYKDRMHNENAHALIVTDFNGVLYSKVAKKRADYASTSEIRKNLLGLTQNKQNHVYVASSKKSEYLGALLGDVPNLGLAAEHSLAIKGRDASHFTYRVHPQAAAAALANIQEEIENTGNFWLAKEFAFSTNYGYDSGDTQVPVVIAELQKRLSSDDKFKANNVAFNIEDDTTNPTAPQIKVMLAIKGKAYVVGEALKHYSYAFGLSLGDKPADEGMHEMMTKYGFLSVYVSADTNAQKKTAANYILRNPDEVAVLLRELAKL
ncbi:hypothetical protein O181_016995 [Austropuccinia psidii MF-1]|uniref:Uncharacterized protein n=1 Tax=Austropuccinia psidii MF-1 TaxID=1389203 RepID=A0A9Q3GSK3_9BASI|nr:hypothetical protein [Austropuccinia psidii MF-1]